jgi:hypothetical protein
MPLARIDLAEGKSTDYRRTIGEVVYDALPEVSKALKDDPGARNCQIGLSAKLDRCATWRHPFLLPAPPSRPLGRNQRRQDRKTSCNCGQINPLVWGGNSRLENLQSSSAWRLAQN